ncbi:MAG: phytoene desaturase [Thermoflavifilum sp.]|nr:phytoene desaturase [Thermoflavifilum sp.]
MHNRVIIIGSGFAGLSASCFLAQQGVEVHVFEALDQPGGRAGLLEEKGFRFDLGPSWYWMPDVFERFFQQFGHQPSDYYQLIRLDPSYRIFWNDGPIDIPAGSAALTELFEKWEPGSGHSLQHYLQEATHKYTVAMQKFVFKPGLSWWEFWDRDIWKAIGKLHLLSSIQKHIAQHFKDWRIRQIMQFPVLFLGALPKHTPALYSLMNYADIVKGTWYPKGGIYEVVKAMYSLALSLGVQFHFQTPVEQIWVKNDRAKGVSVAGEVYSADAVLATADYHHVEQKLIPEKYRQYSSSYWQSRQLSPSCMLYYVGINKNIPGLRHHNLFFDTDFDQHARQIYTHPQWPNDPLFYLSAPSITDSQVAPPHHENLFALIPVAAGLKGDDEKMREKYLQEILKRIQRYTGQSITADDIVYLKTFGPSDFVNRYHAFQGNAYGLANTLRQTAVWKPRMRSSKLENLFFAGQLTVPGPGMPSTIISGEIAARLITKYLHQLLIKI